jgi:thioredoxin reductase
MNKDLKVGIIGAGIQGISNALFLQKKGFEVTILIKMSQVVLLHLMVTLVIFHLTHVC